MSGPRLRHYKRFFDERAQVFADIALQKTWPHTFYSKRSEALPLHWHKGDITLYVLQGATYMLEANGERIDIQKGDKLVIEAGAIHAEGAHEEPVVYIIATPEAITLGTALRQQFTGVEDKQSKL